VFRKSIWVRKNFWGSKRNFPPLLSFSLIFLLILAYDSIYPILAPGLLFFPPHREAGSLVGAYVGATLVFHLTQFSIFWYLRSKICFSFPSEITKLWNLVPWIAKLCHFQKGSIFRKYVFSFVLFQGLASRTLYFLNSQVSSHENANSVLLFVQGIN
jgi:hypothetical protein